MSNKDYIPQLFVALDLDIEDPALTKTLKVIKQKESKEIGIKVHALDDQHKYNQHNDLDYDQIRSNIFYDAKYADIPSTVYSRIKAEQHRDYITVNLEAIDRDGAKYAMKAKHDIIKDKKSDYGAEVKDDLIHAPKILGISILTSKSSQKYALNNGRNKDLAIKNLVLIAIEEGLDGVVVSGHEAAMAKYLVLKHNASTKIIIPGISTPWADYINKTQKRVVTPREAFMNGADSIVVGTTIVKAKDPEVAINKIQLEISETKHELEELKPDINYYKNLMTREQKIAVLDMVEVFQSENGLYSLNQDKYAIGHWCRLTSGLLSPFYVNIGGVLDSEPKILNRIAQDIAKIVREEGLEPDQVIGAAMGSVRLSLVTASYLDIRSGYAEKGDVTKGANETQFVFRRHKINKGEKVIIVDDLITKGTTVKLLIKAIEDQGGEVLKVFLCLNRSGIDRIGTIGISALQELEPFAITQEEFDTNYPKATIIEKPKNNWQELMDSQK